MTTALETACLLPRRHMGGWVNHRIRRLIRVMEGQLWRQHQVPTGLQKTKDTLRNGSIHGLSDATGRSHAISLTSCGSRRWFQDHLSSGALILQMDNEKMFELDPAKL